MLVSPDPSMEIRFVREGRSSIYRALNYKAKKKKNSTKESKGKRFLTGVIRRLEKSKVREIGFLTVVETSTLESLASDYRSSMWLAVGGIHL